MKKIIFFFLLPLSVLSQAKPLSGIIVDSSGKAIPFANVVYGSKNTLSNENGEFELQIENLPTKINVTHLNYEPIEIDIREHRYLKIFLKESIKTLPEAKVGNYAIELIKKTIQKVAQDSVFNHFGRGFYQYVGKNQGGYTSLHEIFFDGNFNGRTGIIRWLPTASRYEIDEVNPGTKNAIYMALINTPPNIHIHLSVDGKLTKIDDIAQYYTFTIDYFLNEGTAEEVAVVFCTPRKKFQTAFTGYFYIKTSNLSVLRVTGKKIILATSNNPFFKVKESYVTMDIQFKEINSTVLLTAMDLIINLNLRTGLFANKNSSERLKLIMYDYTVASKNEYGNLQPFYKTKEYQIFSTTQESPEFWANNSIIKRTPIEVEAIKEFESKKKKSGNMFPNK